MIYDAIVIGSGPAGSTTAKILADKGLSVLILEAQKLPRYKSCSGCLIKRSMDLVQEYFGKAVPETTMCTPFENKGMPCHHISDPYRTDSFHEDPLCLHLRKRLNGAHP